MRVLLFLTLITSRQHCRPDVRRPPPRLCGPAVARLRCIHYHHLDRLPFCLLCQQAHASPQRYRHLLHSRGCLHCMCGPLFPLVITVMIERSVLQTWLPLFTGQANPQLLTHSVLLLGESQFSRIHSHVYSIHPKQSSLVLVHDSSDALDGLCITIENLADRASFPDDRCVRCYARPRRTPTTCDQLIRLDRMAGRYWLPKRIRVCGWYA